MKFDAQNYPYASKRSVVYAKNGMVCVGNPTAASAGLQTLLKGGNAIDAAITVATCQPVLSLPVMAWAVTALHLSGIRVSCMALTAAVRLRWLLLSQL